MRTPRASPSGSSSRSSKSSVAGRLGDRDHHVVVGRTRRDRAEGGGLGRRLMRSRYRRAMAIDHVGAIRVGSGAPAARPGPPVTDGGPDLPRLGCGQAGRPPRAGASLGAAAPSRAGSPRPGLPKPPRRRPSAGLVRGGRRWPGRHPGRHRSRGAGVELRRRARRRRVLARRQALETPVHRWDAEQAAAARAGRRPRWRPTASTSSSPWSGAHASRSMTASTSAGHCTCTAPTSKASGQSTPTTAIYRVERGHAKGDAAVRGPASKLLLVAVQRFGPGRRCRGLRHPRSSTDGSPRHVLSGTGTSPSGAAGARR